MTKEDFKKKYKGLPDEPGVYFFKKRGKVLYVGKATALKDRVSSYFSADLARARGPLIEKMVVEADSIGHETTDSVLEALILEAERIKKYKPYYNSLGKDDKSFNWIVITKEDFPRFLIVRDRDLKLKAKGWKLKARFGPFPSGGQLKVALKIIRKIFPFRDRCIPLISQSLKLQARARPCFNRQIGLCPGVCTGEITKNEYGKNVRNIELFFQGKKKKILQNLKKEMKVLARDRRFEEAILVKRKIFSLEHIQDVSLLKAQVTDSSTGSFDRIEAYDIAHIFGSSSVGVMVVIEGGEPGKSQYRKFKIKGPGKGSIDDTLNLREILKRRFTHPEWPAPQLLVVDGGTAQRNAALAVLEELCQSIPVVGVVKDERHKPRGILGDKHLAEKYKREILLANSEAHRFALKYHRQYRRKNSDLV